MIEDMQGYEDWVMTNDPLYEGTPDPLAILIAEEEDETWF